MPKTGAAATLIPSLPPVILDGLLAVIGLAASALSRIVMADVLGERQPFITAYPVLLALALFRGTRCGVLFLAGALVTHFYLFIEPAYQMRVQRPVDAVVVLAFIMVSVMIVALTHAHKRERTRLSLEVVHRREAEGRVRLLNEELEERVRIRTAQLEEANRELESFSYSVSHDLRAPLRHIAGFADMLEKRIGAGLDESGRRYMKIIRDAVAQAGTLVDDLLAFSRMGRSDLMETRVPMRGMIDETVREFDQETQERGITWKIHDDIPDVHADPAMLRLVWRNLISNAVKYTRKESQPVVEIGIDPDGDAETNSITCFVRDNGVGFDMKYADKLFGVFQRLHRSDEFEGTGIGLANVRRIIQRHGGKVWVKAAPGEGAAFFFTLPAERERTGE